MNANAAGYLVNVLRHGALFRRREGGRFPADSARFELSVISAPAIAVTSGVVAFEEFYDLDYERVEDCHFDVGAGEWPLILANLQEGSLPAGLTIAWFVGSPGDALAWEAPSSSQQMVGTSYGTVCVYDRGNRPLLAGLALTNEKELARITDDVEQTGFGLLRGSAEENLMTVVQCYGGVGTHWVWRGLDANGVVVCLMVDTGAMSDFEPIDVARSPVGH